MLTLMAEEQIDAVMHSPPKAMSTARSMGGHLVETNVVGTFRLLNAALAYWRDRDAAGKEGFRFHHISTDEVFGDLPSTGHLHRAERLRSVLALFGVEGRGDHFVRAWHETYGLPVVLSNCSNNYGPSTSGKLIPLAILNAIEGKAAAGLRSAAKRRDWLHVEDHARALELIVGKGRWARVTMSAAVPSAPICRWSRRSAISSTIAWRRGRGATSSPSSRTDRANDRRYAIDRRRSRMSWGGARGKLRKRPCQDSRLVPCQ
jgi:dTDP-glucose 4,6-dehydratase